MKIAIAGGHSKKAGGAAGLLNEYECDRQFVAKLIPALQKAGFTVVNCSNEKATVNDELAEECRLANNSKSDLFIAIHFNAGGGTGTECYYFGGDSKGKAYAQKLSKNVSYALGIPDRGAKANTDFYVLRNTNMTAVLLEMCFVDSQADYKAWKNTSWDALCNAVVTALGGKATETKPAAPSNPTTPSKPAASDDFKGGKYKVMTDMNVRDKPSLSGKIVASYKKGQTVNLDDTYKIADGYVWGTYIAYSGQRRYIAVGKATGKPEADDFLIRVS